MIQPFQNMEELALVHAQENHQTRFITAIIVNLQGIGSEHLAAQIGRHLYDSDTCPTPTFVRQRNYCCRTNVVSPAAHSRP